MAFYDKFPYTNFQELNLDWITQEISKVRDNRDATDASAAAALASEQAAKASETAAITSETAAKASETAAAESASGIEAAREQIYLNKARLDNLIVDGTPTEGNTELLDIRVGGNGVTYPTAGDAVRAQYYDLKLDKEMDFLQVNPINYFENPIFSENNNYSIYGMNNFFTFKNQSNVEGDAPNGYGAAVKVNTKSQGLGYIMDIEKIETGDYKVSIERSNSAGTYNGRLQVFHALFENGVIKSSSPVYNQFTTAQKAEWDVSIDIEEIKKVQPTANVLIFIWTNSSEVTTYFYAPMLYKDEADVKTDFVIFNKEIEDLISSSFVPGIYDQVEITYLSKDGFYAYGNSTFEEYSRLHASKLLPINAKYVKFSGATWANVPALKFYDGNSHFISDFPATRPAEPTAYTDEVVPVPAIAAYVIIQDVTKYFSSPTPALSESKGYSAKEAEYVKNTENFLHGKKLVTAGDSYTAADFSGDYAEYNGKNFGYYIAQRNGMKFVNSGISGSTMAVPNDEGDRQPFSGTRYLNVPEDTDYLTIWFGINDEAHCTLGTIDDTENTTFYGAWNKVLRYYLENRPFMKVLIIILTNGSNDTYRQAIRDCAKKWGYPYMDWVRDYSIPAFFTRDDMSAEARNIRRDKFGWNTFSAHPSPQWHEYESTVIETKLRSI